MGDDPVVGGACVMGDDSVVGVTVVDVVDGGR